MSAAKGLCKWVTGTKVPLKNLRQDAKRFFVHLSKGYDIIYLSRVIISAVRLEVTCPGIVSGLFCFIDDSLYQVKDMRQSHYSEL